MESPIELVATTIAVTTAGAGAIWATVQAFERIFMLPLNRRKAELEVRKLELEVQRLATNWSVETAEAPSLESELELSEEEHDIKDDEQPISRSSAQSASPPKNRLAGRLDVSNSSRYTGDVSQRVIETVERRLLRNPIQVEQLEVEFDSKLIQPASKR